MIWANFIAPQIFSSWYGYVDMTNKKISVIKFKVVTNIVSFLNLASTNNHAFKLFYNLFYC